MSKDHFLKMLEDLKTYINLDIEMEGEAVDSNTGKIYPIGRLRDVLVHFNHYDSFEEAKLKWDTRKQKINWDNLFVEMFALNVEEAERFDRLPYRKKICFVPFETDIPSAVNVGMFNNIIAGDIKRKFYENINKLAINQIYYYDVLKLLNGESDFIR